MTVTRAYGPLIITLTSAYDWRWNDRGSGADRDGGFWHPKPQGGLRAVGSVAVGNYNDLNNNWAVMLVGDNPDNHRPGEAPAVQSPVDYQGLWNDKGSGSASDGSFWRPVAPAGYIALGDVAWGGYDKPPTDQVWCIRADLVSDGAFNENSVWDDRGSGADSDSSFWEIIPRARNSASEYIPVLAGTFRFNGGYSSPDPSLAKVPSLYVPKPINQSSPSPPQITASTIPDTGETFSQTAQTAITLPFTSLFEPSDRASLDLLSTSPFCTVTKSTSWLVLEKFPNYQSVPYTQTQTVMTGVRKSTSSTTSHTTGVTISSEVGYGLSKWSVSLNYQFSLSTTSSFEEVQERTMSKTLTVAPHTVAIAWAKRVTIQGVRADGSRIGVETTFNASEEIAVTEVPV